MNRILILFLFLLPQSVFAYEWISTNHSGDGSPSTGLVSGANGSMVVALDCARAGIGDISRIDFDLDATGVSTARAHLDGYRANIWNEKDKRATSTTINASTTLGWFSFSWATPVYCNGRTINLVIDRLSGTLITPSAIGWTDRASLLSGGPASGYSFPYQLGTCSGKETTCITSGGYITMLNVIGADATSTASGGSNSTTTYNFNFSTSTLTATDTSSSSSGDSLWISLIALVFLIYGFITITYKQIFGT